jgi:phosphoadenosine phosphosulfate reductase
MSSMELIDELEAGELSIAFEGEEPEALLAWGIERFGPGIAISTSFQVDSVVLIDMAYAIDPEIAVFSVDTGRLPAETLELADRLRARYPGLRLELVEPSPDEVAAMTGKHGVDLFHTSVDLRLLCCNIRKVRPLTRHLHSLDAWVTGLRRDQWASRTNIRKIEIDHDHGAVIKLNPLAEWTEEEVWDYVRDREVPYHSLYDRGYTSIGCAPAPAPSPPASRAGPGAGGGSRTPPRSVGSTARSRAAASSTSCMR